MDIVTLAIVGLLIVISPGADFVLVLKNSLSHGRRAGLLSALGISLAITVHIGYSLLGISYLISHNELLFNLIKYAGATYLVYLGIKGIFAASAQTIITAEQDNSLPSYRYFAQGFLCNVLNPKTMLFFLSIFSQVISEDGASSTQALIYGGYMVVLHGVWFALVATLMTSTALQHKLERVKPLINKACGVGLVSFGAALALKA
ncbi:lysine transporter LysE [Vibrio furnissii]|uniref:Lysine transporter LysE n=1 Tax=Vibrio furnissii TaxID=29494 RepID=A0A0Q2R5Y0_VIBFU|nr:LysE family transporter [Vibrio furnissii]KQH87525.1 lysine transporter LysE [Vibrio furnissii]